jgi:polyisoprenoid-binding protein YceI
MKIKQISILILLFVNLQNINAQNWKPVSTSFSFTTKMLGIKVDGKFKGFQGNIVFDESNLQNASISGTVDASTIDTDNSLRNSHLKEKEEFFEVAKYPKIKMVSTSIQKTASGYVGTFNLTIKSITKSIKIPFDVQMNGDKATFKGTTQVNRKDWKIGGNTVGMSSDVTLNLTINATK